MLPLPSEMATEMGLDATHVVYWLTVSLLRALDSDQHPLV